MRLHRVSFSARLMLFSTGLVCLTVGLLSAIVYLWAKDRLEDKLAGELLSIARSTSALLDADLVPLVYRDPDGHVAFEDEFQVLRDQLDRVRQRNGLPADANPIYVMRPAADFDSSGQLEFVAMPDRGDTGEFFVGNRYPAQDHHRESLGGRPAASGVYADDEGVWISASAPLWDSGGSLVGLVQVDRPVNFFYERARAQALGISWAAAVAILAGAALAWLLARSLVRPIREVVDAVTDFGAGNRTRRVSTGRGDELGELARGFNTMADGLGAQTDDLEQARLSAERAKEETSEALSNARTLNRVLAALADAESPESVLRKALEAVCESYGWSGAGYWLRVDDELRISLQVGSFDAGLNSANVRAALSRGAGLPGEAWDRGEVLVVTSDADSDERRAPLTRALRQAGVRGAVAVPIQMGDGLHGVAEFYAVRGTSTSATALRETLTSVGRVLATALDRIEGAEAEQMSALDTMTVDRAVRAVSELESEAEVAETALSTICESFGWPFGGYWSGEGPDERAISHSAADGESPFSEPGLRAQVGLAGAAWSDRDFVRPTASLHELDDCARARKALELGLASGCAVPLVVGTRTFGVFEFFVTSARDLTPTRERALQHIARLVAGKLERLQGATRRAESVAIAARVMASVARGNLRDRMEGHFEDEFALLRDSVNDSIENLARMVLAIGDASSSLASGADQIRSGNEDLADRTRSQAAALHQCEEAVGAVSALVERSVEGAERARALATRTRSLAAGGGESVQQVTDAMEQIETTSERIANVVGSIDSIAEQTNLLALNAAIEAARAGELGRGFAVVAESVRQLAAKSAASAREVRELLSDSTKAVQLGIDAVKGSGDALGEILRAASDTDEIIQERAAESGAHAQQVAQLKTAMTELEVVTQQNAVLVEEVAAASQTMSSHCAELARRAASFDVD